MPHPEPPTHPPALDPTTAEWWDARPWRRAHLRRLGLVRVAPGRARLLRLAERCPPLQRLLLPGRVIVRRLERRRLDARLFELLRRFRVIFRHYLCRCPEFGQFLFRTAAAVRFLALAIGFVVRDGGPGACRRLARATAGISAIAVSRF